MANFGTPLGVDQLLRLSGMAHAYTNERMGRANALRGLTGLRSVGDPSTGIDTSLRGLSTARDDEITNAIFADIVAETTTDITGEELPIISQEQFETKFRKKYPQYVDRYLAEGLKLFGAHRSRERGEQGELRTVLQGASERQANTYFNSLRKAWDSLPKDKQTQAMFDRLYHQWSSKVAGDNAAEEEFVRLRNMVFGTRADMAARTPAAIEKARVAADQAALTLRKGLATEDADIKKAQIEFDKAELALSEAKELSTTKIAKAKEELRKTQGVDYKEGLARMDKVADKFERETNPDRYAVAEEQVDQELRGLNLDGSQVEKIRSALAIRLHHLAAPDIPTGAKAFIWAYKAADPTGKTKAEHRKELVVLREFLKKHYRVDYEMLGMMGPGSWYAENINQIVDSAIEALTPDAELKPIRELKGTGKRGKDGVIDRLLVNRLPTRDEAQSFANRGIIYIITINGQKKKISLQPQG